MDWKIISKNIVFDGFLSIEEYQLTHDLYQGGQSDILTRQLMERGHAVAVLLFDPVADSVVLIEQFRIGAKDDEVTPWLTELVAGMIEANESVLEVAERECLEEAGVTISNCRLIHTYYVSPGGCSEKISLYYAEVDSSTARGYHGLDSENEDIKVIVLDYEEVIRQMQDGKINSATPILALQWLQLNHDELVSGSNTSTSD